MTPTTPDTQAQEPRARAERDGCGCPAWVLRCLHWEGRILVLVDRKLVLSCSLAGNPQAGFACWDLAHFASKQRCCGRHYALLDRRNFKAYGIDLPAAEAEFARRERQLLGRSDG